jgi:uncharacterized cupin superfamily protein
MSDVTVKRVSDIDYYRGEHKLEGIQFRYAGKELGVTAWGMNVIDMDPACEQYPEHDHVANGQEEVYVLLRGSAILKVGAQEHVLEQGVLARVGPGEKRKIVAGVDGATVLAIGATPGKAYEPGTK